MESTNSKQINPWIYLWTSPKKTIRSILNVNPYRLIVWLAIISGIISSFSWLGLLWKAYPFDMTYKNTVFIMTTLIVGGILGLIHLYFGGWLYRLTGNWVGGKGNYTQLKCAVGWSSYPYIIAGIFGILALLFVNPWVRFAFSILNAIAAIWAFIIFMNLLGEAHKISAWRALLAFLIALVLVCAVLVLILLLVPLLQPLFE